MDEWPEGSDYILNAQALVYHGYSATYFDRIVTKFALGGVSTSNFAVENMQCVKLVDIIRDKFFEKPIACDPNEYVFAPAMPFKARLTQYLKRTLPFRAARWMVHILTHRIVNELNVQLGFQQRTDSIYQRIDMLASAISAQREYTTSLDREIQQRSDVIDQQNENLTAAVGKLLANAADLRQILQQRSDVIDFMDMNPQDKFF